MNDEDHHDLYELLGVPPTATIEQIKTAYRAKIQENHPDRHDGSLHAQILTARLNAAFARLRDPKTRQHYDAQRNRDLRNERGRARAQLRGGSQVQPRVPAVRSAASNHRSLRADPVVGVGHASPRAGGGWAALLAIGGLIASAVLLANKNAYDGNVGRYRGRGGQFRKGPFF